MYKVYGCFVLFDIVMLPFPLVFAGLGPMMSSAEQLEQVKYTKTSCARNLIRLCVWVNNRFITNVHKHTSLEEIFCLGQVGTTPLQFWLYVVSVQHVAVYHECSGVCKSNTYRTLVCTVSGWLLAPPPIAEWVDFCSLLSHRRTSAKSAW